MKATLIALGLFFSINVSAQCTYIWERTDEDSATNIEQHLLPGIIQGPDGYKLSKRLLDSLINQVRIQPAPYYIKVLDSTKFRNNDPDVSSYIDTVKSTSVDANGNVAFNYDFKIFRFTGKDIVHYSTTKYFLDNDSVEVHQFEYCVKEWSEDFFHNTVLYTTEFGAVYEVQGVAGDPSWTDYRLINNTCISKEKNEKIMKLLNEMDKK